MIWILLITALYSAMALPATLVIAGTSGKGAPDPFDGQAIQVVADLAAGDFADVAAQFDPVVSAQLSAAGLAGAWSDYQALLGAFQSAGQPTSVMLQGLTVEQVPVQLAQGPGEVRIAFHPDGTIAGIFFLRPGVPLPGAS